MSFAEDMFDQNNWANVHLVRFCSGLDDEQLDSGSEGNYGTVRETLLHIARAQDRYVARITQGNIDGLALESEGFPGFDVLEKSLSESGARLRELSASINTDEVREIETQMGPYRLQLGVILVQAINHATEHRTQIKTVLSSLGLEPPELDSWTWSPEVGKLEKL